MEKILQVEEVEHVAFPAVEKYEETGKDFESFYCKDEVEFTAFNKKFYNADSMIVIPGKSVIGKGLNANLEQCIVYIKRKGVKFVFHNGDEIKGELLQPLDPNCGLIFLGETQEAFILLPTEDGAGSTLYRFEDDVEIEVFFETEGYRGRNRYYGCLIKDTPGGLEMCSVTADPKAAEFLLSFFIGICR